MMNGRSRLNNSIGQLAGRDDETLRLLKCCWPITYASSKLLIRRDGWLEVS